MDAARRRPRRGLRHTSLRYFNVVGSGSPDLYDTSPHNLFPLVLAALTDGRTPVVRGVDYPTPDGSCVRDYVHVQDVADAHVAAARALADGRPLAPVYNLGSGTGVSVLEIMAAMARRTGRRSSPRSGTAGPGDPARIVRLRRARRPRPRLGDPSGPRRLRGLRLGGVDRRDRPGLTARYPGRTAGPPSPLERLVARVVVDVMLKPEILDPQGQAVQGALGRLGFEGVTSVRQGKRFEIEVDGPVRRRARPGPRRWRAPCWPTR